MRLRDQLYDEWPRAEDAEEYDCEQNTIRFVGDQLTAEMGQQNACRNDACQCGNGKTPE